MSDVLPIRSPRHGGTRLLALLAAVLLTPGLVEASCGDYVIVTNPRNSGAPGSLHPSSFTGTDFRVHHVLNSYTSEAGGKESSKPIRIPCQGPTCSKRSGTPIVPTPQLNLSVDRWAFASNVQSWELHSFPKRMLPESRILREIVYAASILRPPRLSGAHSSP